MKYDRTNKRHPDVRYRVEHPFTSLTPVFSWDVKFWVAKFKDGVYRPKHRYIASGVPRSDGERKLLEDTKRVIKQGKYHDWFFESKPPVITGVREP